MVMIINSVVKNCDVYVRNRDIINSLKIDLAEATDEMLKKYIKAQIELWEKYDSDILSQYRGRIRSLFW